MRNETTLTQQDVSDILAALDQQVISYRNASKSSRFEENQQAATRLSDLRERLSQELPHSPESEPLKHDHISPNAVVYKTVGEQQ